MDTIFDLFSRQLAVGDDDTRRIFSDTILRTFVTKSTKSFGWEAKLAQVFALIIAPSPPYHCSDSAFPPNPHFILFIIPISRFSTSNFQLRTLKYILDLLLYTFHSSDSVMYDDDLTSSIEFIFDSLQDYRFIPSCNDSLYGFFLFWRGSEDRDLLEP